jgi:hypothetical protein
MYASDYRGRLVPNIALGDPGYLTDTWILGDMSNAVGATNELYIRNGKLTNELYIRNGKLFPYNTSVKIYHCPADRATVSIGGVALPRVRSLSLSGQMAGDRGLIPGFPPNLKETDILFPPSSKALLFIDERSDSIDDGYYAISLTPASWQNVPAWWHNRGDVVSFADGHAEHWRWLEASTILARFPYGAVNTPVDRDFDRVHRAYASRE